MPTRKIGQSGCPLGNIGSCPLDREAGAGGTQSVIRLVAALVEDGKDLVADELRDLAVELVPDEGSQPPEVGDQHRVHLGGRALFGERRETDEVGEQHADLLVAAQSLLQIQAAEALLVPLARRR